MKTETKLKQKRNPICLVMVLMAIIFISPVQAQTKRDHRTKKAEVTKSTDAKVRDHRTKKAEVTKSTDAKVRDHRTKKAEVNKSNDAEVRDHRTKKEEVNKSTEVKVRDHRTKKESSEFNTDKKSIKEESTEVKSKNILIAQKKSKKEELIEKDGEIEKLIKESSKFNTDKDNAEKAEDGNTYEKKKRDVLKAERDDQIEASEVKVRDHRTKKEEVNKSTDAKVRDHRTKKTAKAMEQTSKKISTEETGNRLNEGFEETSEEVRTEKTTVKKDVQTAKKDQLKKRKDALEVNAADLKDKGTIIRTQEQKTKKANKKELKKINRVFQVSTSPEAMRAPLNSTSSKTTKMVVKPRPLNTNTQSNDVQLLHKKLDNKKNKKKKKELKKVYTQEISSGRVTTVEVKN